MIAFIVGSSEPTDARTLDEYGLRFDIEESFLDEKSGGYQLHTSQLATPEALERLLLMVAIATLHSRESGSRSRSCTEAELSWMPIGIAV